MLRTQRPELDPGSGPLDGSARVRAPPSGAAVARGRGRDAGGAVGGRPPRTRPWRRAQPAVTAGTHTATTVKPCAALGSLLSTRALHAWPPGWGKLSTTEVFVLSSTPTPPPMANIPGGQVADAPATTVAWFPAASGGGAAGTPEGALTYV